MLNFGLRTLNRINQTTIMIQLKLKTAFLVLLASILTSCEKNKDQGLNPVYGPVVTMQFGEVSAQVQELSFNSGNFYIVGDLRTPIGEDLFPVIIMVHGSGGATRHGAVDFETLIEIFIRNGFAVLSWDKPGSGESRGSFTQGYSLTERANIILDAIKVLVTNPSINSTSIGLWGISQAGWVMPLALEKTQDIAFVIVVSGGGEDSIEQMAYQVGQVVACGGGSLEQVSDVEKYWSQMNKAQEYNEYREAAEILVNIPGVSEYTGLTVSEQNQWSAWPREIDAFFNPMDVIEHTTIPMLVHFGELDKNVDPMQGAQAYKAAFEKAGNKDNMVIIIQDVGHVLIPVTTGCLDEPVSGEWVTEYLDTLENWVIDHHP
jgi:pimeloyl-ACP methyl ester carboxylesterase